MIAPYKFKQAIIKNGMEELSPSKYNFEDYYDICITIVDLTEVVMMWSSTDNTTLLLLKSGLHIKAMVSPNEMETVINEMSKITANLIWQKAHN